MKWMHWFVVSWLIAPVAGGQTVDRSWIATSVITQQRLAQGDSWSNVSTALVRRTGSGAIGIDWARIQYGARIDRSLGVDIYRTLGKGAYTRTRVQIAGPQTILPRWDVSAQFNQAVTDWEIGVDYRLRLFSASAVHSVSAGLARYQGDWLLFARASVLTGLTRASGSIQLGARRYGSDPQNYVELAFGAGREALALSSISATILQAWSVSARVQRYVSDTIGVTAGLSHVSGSPLTRSGFHFGLVTRW